MIEHAYAKINLILDIKGKRADGYHELKSLMIPIDYYDTLEFKLSDDLSLTSNVEIENNGVLKVMQYMKDTYQVKTGAHIHLHKQIPIGAGLAGGSSDMTAAIRGLDRLWGLNLGNPEKEDLANRFGSDTLFTLYSEPAIITGRGDLIERIEMPHKLEDIVLIIPAISLLTKEVFKAFKKETSKDFDVAYQAALQGDYSKLYNDLLDAALNSNHTYKTLYQQLVSSGLNIHLSGSGSTFFILNPSKRDLDLLSHFKELKIIRTKQR
ncbi:MAG: 4-(cytidine 5'-diphospho)-2-C-methyl-D-erythritol kinase [Tenericutes bacterium HGW-Tenericutes-8]|nr:MAG: 4-(cytidine 5'-diphospho)-2-C-methyl-D-erythritol kinase [Tenericutes bacterium HGW-Tenericutes-8]